jgi:hypothetical protein
LQNNIIILKLIRRLERHVERCVYKFFSERMKREHLKDLDVDGRIIFKRILKKG